MSPETGDISQQLHSTEPRLKKKHLLSEEKQLQPEKGKCYVCNPVVLSKARARGRAATEVALGWQLERSLVRRMQPHPRLPTER
jgi:hypothetical protein